MASSLEALRKRIITSPKLFFAFDLDSTAKEEMHKNLRYYLIPTNPVFGLKALLFIKVSDNFFISLLGLILVDRDRKEKERYLGQTGSFCLHLSRWGHTSFDQESNRKKGQNWRFDLVLEPRLIVALFLFLLLFVGFRTSLESRSFPTSHSGQKLPLVNSSNSSLVLERAFSFGGKWSCDQVHERNGSAQAERAE